MLLYLVVGAHKTTFCILPGFVQGSTPKIANKNMPGFCQVSYKIPFINYFSSICFMASSSRYFKIIFQVLCHSVLLWSIQVVFLHSCNQFTEWLCRSGFQSSFILLLSDYIFLGMPASHDCLFLVLCSRHKRTQCCLRYSNNHGMWRICHACDVIIFDSRADWAR